MPRGTPGQTISDLVDEAIASVVARAVKNIEKVVADAVAAEFKRSTRAQPAGKAAGRRKARRRRRAARAEMTKWVADNRARRVPNFVIEMTGGLDTKKRIVAKFGEAVFEKGKPLPPVKADGAGKIAAGIGAAPRAERVVKAKVPVRRKAAATK